MTEESPFSLYRFEYEPEHLYYLEPQLFKRLEQHKPMYLVGSRGTGKTTLLKALNWKERIENASLREALGGDPFESNYIGLYLKLPEIQLEALNQWLLEEDKQLHAELISFYLDLTWIEQACEALADLVADGMFDVSVTKEEECVSLLNEEFESILSELHEKPPKTLKDYSRFVRKARRDIELASKLYLKPSELVTRYQIVYQIGEFGRKVGKHLLTLCTQYKKEDTQWYFKVCMDEGECLCEFHQLVVNTMFRVAQTPVFPLVSFVSTPKDTSTTLIRNLTLQQADRDLIPLDESSDSEFQRLVEGVATVRVRHKLGQSEAQFDAKRILGPLDINSMLHRTLSESVSPFARRLLEQAEELSQHPMFMEEREKNTANTEGEVLPIYQAYLVDKLKIQIPDPKSPRWKRRHQSSAELRKRFVAAYLSICREMKTEPKYASAKMVLQMSDMCVRDYLHQIDQIFRRSEEPLEAFLEKKVSNETQNDALKDASRAKKDSVPQSGVSAPGETGSIIKGLATITAHIQSESGGTLHLTSSERGVFAWQCGDFPDEVESRMMTTIREASEAGFLRLIPTETGYYKFRVHTSLAASYGFSYRGAYYECPISLDDLNRLRLTKDEKALAKVAQEIAHKFGDASSKNLDMFESPNDERNNQA